VKLEWKPRMHWPTLVGAIIQRLKTWNKSFLEKKYSFDQTIQLISNTNGYGLLQADLIFKNLASGIY